MQIIDYSYFQKNGIRINRLRLIHSRGLSSARVNELREQYRKSEDLASEKRLIVSHLTEIVVIKFTLFYLFAGLMYLCGLISVASLFFNQHRFMASVTSVVAAFVFYRIASKFREDFIMGSVGIDMTESIYEGMIKDKYNF